MNKIFRIKITVAGFLTLMCLAWAGCESSSSDSGGGETTFTNNVWRLQSETYRCTAEDVEDDICDTAGELVSASFPQISSEDFDDDGSTESLEFNVYMTLDDGTSRLFISYDITDEGTVTGEFAAFLSEYYGMAEGAFYCSSNDFNYTVDGNTYTNDEGDEMTVEFSNGGNTMTMTNPDDTDEESVYVKVDSITATENCAAFGGKAVKSPKSLKKPVKVIARAAFRH